MDSLAFESPNFGLKADWVIWVPVLFSRDLEPFGSFEPGLISPCFLIRSPNFLKSAVSLFACSIFRWRYFGGDGESQTYRVGNSHWVNMEEILINFTTFFISFSSLLVNPDPFDSAMIHEFHTTACNKCGHLVDWIDLRASFVPQMCLDVFQNLKVAILIFCPPLREASNDRFWTKVSATFF